jgi:hypothetical protein
MARSIVVNFGGEVSEFAITRLRRDKLYGRKKKVVVDEDGHECSSAYLTRDGAALLPSGSMASLYVDDEFNVCERRDRVAVDDDGEALERIDSTLGSEQPLEGPVDARRVLEHVTTAVYELVADELGESLKAALEDGDIFETRFNYRSGYSDAPAFLLANDEGYFALIGEATGFDFMRPEAVDTVEDEDDGEDPFGDDLDFSF